jgi:hypothetical protein
MKRVIRFASRQGLENISPGWKGKECYRFLGLEGLIETFELKAPTRNFEIYSEKRLQRVRSE